MDETKSASHVPGRRILDDLRADRVRIAVAAAVVFTVESIAWPLQGGRDDLNYWLYFHDFWSEEPSHALLLAYRTPLPALVLGPILEWGGALLTEVFLGLLYVGAILAVHRIGAFWGRAAGIAGAVAVLAYLPFGALFHTAASDAPFAFAVVVLVAFVLTCAERPSLGRFAVAGLALAAVVLVRPGGQVFALLAVVPLLVAGLSIRARVARAALFLGTAAVLLAGWATHNYIRLDDFTVSRGTGAITPFYRLWTDNLIRPDNGEASRELAAAVEEDLLQTEPYRSYRVDVDRFFGSASGRGWSDLVTLSDRRWGWDDDYSVLAGASREAIVAHPWPYTKEVVVTLGQFLLRPYLPYFPVPPRRPYAPPGEPPVLIPEPGEGELATPSEGDVIPLARYPWLMSSPDGRVDVDWSDGRQRLVFDDPAIERRYGAVVDRARRMGHELPGRGYWSPLTTALGRLADIYPPLLAWTLLGLVGAAMRRPPRLRFLLALGAIACVYLLVVALGLPTILPYRHPVEPLLIVFGIAAVLGGRANFKRRA